MAFVSNEVGKRTMKIWYSYSKIIDTTSPLQAPIISSYHRNPLSNLQFIFFTSSQNEFYVLRNGSLKESLRNKGRDLSVVKSFITETNIWIFFYFFVSNFVYWKASSVHSLKDSQHDITRCQVRAANLNTVARQLRVNWRNAVIIESLYREWESHSHNDPCGVPQKCVFITIDWQTRHKPRP